MFLSRNKQSFFLFLPPFLEENQVNLPFFLCCIYTVFFFYAKNNLNWENKNKQGNGQWRVFLVENIQLQTIFNKFLLFIFVLITFREQLKMRDGKSFNLSFNIYNLKRFSTFSSFILRSHVTFSLTEAYLLKVSFQLNIACIIPSHVAISLTCPNDFKIF